MMNRPSLTLNSFWLLLTRLGTQALMIVFVGVVARRLGGAGLGQYAYVASLVFIGNAFTTFGTDTLLIREVAQTGHTRTPVFPASLWIQLGLSALWLFGVAVAGAAVPGQSSETLLALNLYSLALIPMAFYTVFSATLRAYERMDLFLLLNLCISLLQTGGAALVLTTHASLLALCALLLAVQTVTAGLAGVACAFLLPGFTWHWRVTRAELSVVLRAALPLAGLSILAIVSQRLNILMLSTITGDAATGWFSAAARVVEGLKIGHYAVLGALFPVLARGMRPDGAERPRFNAGQALRPSLIRLLGLAAGMALAITALAGPLVPLIYGPRFEPSIRALQILVWSLIPYTLTAVISLRLVASGAEGVVLKGTAAALALSFGLYALLIPRFGLMGACWGMLAAECVQAGIFLWLNIIGGSQHDGEHPERRPALLSEAQRSRRIAGSSRRMRVGER
jgi:O-antigen/teichoic acid export membrane protein